MPTTLLTTGLACLIAAIVGGSLKAFGIEMPALASRQRQAALGALGLVLASSGLWLGQPPAPASMVLTRGTWTLVRAIDTAGNDWSNSTLKFISQRKDGGGYRVAGFFEWRLQDSLIGKEQFEGHYDAALAQIIFEGKSVAGENGYTEGTLRLGSYSAKLSPDGLALTDGSWGTVAGVREANALGHWQATR